MASKPIKRILLTGGGTGGHIYPLLAVTDALRDQAVKFNIDLELHYLGALDSYYAAALGNAGIKVGQVVSAKLRRYFSPANVLDIPKFFIGFFQTFLKMFFIMPDVIFSKGGPGAWSVVLCGRFYRIPVVIHESDAKPGLTNLLSSPFAVKIAVSFEAAKKYFNPQKTFVSGGLLRKELFSNRLEQATAKEQLNFDPQKSLTLILGGSQGSRRINEFILLNVKSLIPETQILHQTGKTNYGEFQKLSRAALLDVSLQAEVQNRYQPMPYLEENLPIALSAADAIVSRAGSGSIFEIAAFGKPSVLIPLSESAGDHQRLNAYEYAKNGAAAVIEEQNLFPEILISQIKNILQNEAVRVKMSQAAAQFFKSGGPELVAEAILELA